MPKHYPLLHDGEALRALRRTHTILQIAALVGCSRRGVIVALGRHGLTRDHTPPRLKDAAWVKAQYIDANRTAREIATDIGCDYQSVLNAVRRFGLPVRPKHCRVVSNPKTGYSQRKPKRPGGSTLYHRQLVEAALGITLDPSQHVHHKDGNSMNNDLTNLQVLSKTEHHRLHAHARWSAKKSHRHAAISSARKSSDC